MKKRNLTANTYNKYKLIVDEWFINKFNGAAAYRAFYPNTKKDQTATVNFSQIQAIPVIKEYIAEKHKEAAKVVGMSHEGILQELKNWLEFDLRDTIGLNSQQLKELPVEIGRLITRFKTRTKRHYDKEGELLFEEDTIELHFVSKEKAMEMINKHIGFYEKDNNQKSNDINILTTNDKHLTIVSKILNGEK